MKVRLKYSILSKIPFADILYLMEEEGINYQILYAKEDGRAIQHEDHLIITEATLDIVDNDSLCKFLKIMQRELGILTEKDPLVILDIL